MNPNDPQNQPSSRPIPTPPPRAGYDPTRNATADVARSQISQIFGVDEPAAPAQTSSPTNTQPLAVPQDQVQPAQQTAEIAKTQPTAESTSNPEPETNQPHHEYHNAWQNYYQDYYQKYYISEMEKQRQNFAHQTASVNDKTQDDGTLTQKEAVEDLKSNLIHKIKGRAKNVRKSRHFVPAIAAVVVILIAAFIQYNGLIFAQVSTFISPGAGTSSNIIIGTGNDQPVSPDPRVIIPKINVNAPVIYGLEDLSEASSQEALRNGVIHYPISGANAFPGQRGNTVLLGHSSADFFKPGDFKFIFVQLNRLTTGDLFYLDYEGKRFTYRIFKTEIIAPNDVGRLAIGDDKPYATLITCDPPGTSLRRLVVYGEQISPDPSNSTESQNSDSEATARDSITGAPPTLFEQIFGGR